MISRLAKMFLLVVVFGAAALPLSAATKVGVTSAVNQHARGISGKGKVRHLILGNKIYFNERINTAGTGLVQILFIDGSTITVGANASLVIDKFVYDPKKGKGKLAVSFGKGVMRFIGGKISKNKDGVIVRTVVGTAGIRGGMANIAVNGRKGVFSFLYGRELVFRGLNGERRRIYEQGYTLLAERGAHRKINTRLIIRRTRRGETELFANNLVSRANQRGGTRKKLTNAQVRRGLSGSRVFGVVLPRVKPRRLPRGVVTTPRFDLERQWGDVNPNFDRDIVCVTPTYAYPGGGGAYDDYGPSMTEPTPGLTPPPPPPTAPQVTLPPGC